MGRVVWAENVKRINNIISKQWLKMCGCRHRFVCFETFQEDCKEVAEKKE